MTLTHDAAPGGQPGANGTATKHPQDTTAPGHEHRLDDHVATAFLFAAFTSPATAVATLADTLTGHDFPHPHQHVVWQAITHHATHQANTDDRHLPVPAETVLGYLKATGRWAREVATLMLAALDGNRAGVPLPATALGDLAEQLRHGRLRRACITTGTALADAGREGSTEDITRALAHVIRHMPAVARRAGLEVEPG